MIKTKIAVPLIPIQEIDLQIFYIKKEKEKLPLKIDEYDNTVKSAEVELESVKAEIKQSKLDASKKELALKEAEEKIRQVSVKANIVRKNEEYQAIMKESTGLKADKSLLEDEILGLYTIVEEKEKLQKDKDAHLKQVKEKFNVEKKKIEMELANLDAKLSELEGKRTALTKDIEKDVLTQYQRILSAKSDGVALAEVEEIKGKEEDTYICQNCMVSVTSQDANLLMQGKELVFCCTCSRILYLKE